MHSDTQIERRAAQRFDVQLPVSLRIANETKESRGITKDVSASGAMLYIERTLNENSRIELIFVMPSEITFEGNLRVRCQGKILRVIPPQVGMNYSVAIHFEHYEFLPEKDAVVGYAPAMQEQEREELSLSSHVFHARNSFSF